MSTWTGWVTFFKTMNTIRQGKRKYNPYALNTGLLANKANVVPTTVYHQNIHCPEEKLDEELNVLMCFPLFSGLKYKINAKKKVTSPFCTSRSRTSSNSFSWTFGGRSSISTKEKEKKKTWIFLPFLHNVHYKVYITSYFGSLFA